MLTITYRVGRNFRYRVSGRLTAAELRAYYRAVAEQSRRFGRLDLTVRVTGFRGYAGARALVVFLTHEWRLPGRVRSYVAYADQRWFVRLLRVAGAVVPGVRVRAIYEQPR